MTAWTDTQVITTLRPRPADAPSARPASGVPAPGPDGGASVSAVDADAAEELFKRHYPKLAGWVRRLVDDDETAHELASEAFVRLLSRPLRAVDSPPKYLYTTAGNLIRDHWRKTKRERRAMSSVTSLAAAEPLIYPTEDVDVRQLIASLPPRLREPFLLYYYGDLGIREVAALLRKPEGTIKADLFAARARLKTALAQDAAA